MSKLAHSNTKTMDELEFRAALRDGNEDLYFDALEKWVRAKPRPAPRRLMLPGWAAGLVYGFMLGLVAGLSIR